MPYWRRTPRPPTPSTSSVSTSLSANAQMSCLPPSSTNVSAQRAKTIYSLRRRIEQRRKIGETSVNQTDAREIRQVAQFRVRPAHPDGERFADNILVRNHAQQRLGNGRIVPVTAVVGVVAVVAHHEVMPLRHHPLASRLSPITIHFLADHVFGRAQALLVESHATEAAWLFAEQLLGDRLTVDEQALVAAVANLITRQAHHTLDVVDVRVARVTEHHDIATLRVVHLDDLGVQHRQANTVGELVDQDEIPHFQGGLHRAGRNLERLDQKGTQHQHDRQHREERFTVFHQQWLFVQALDYRLVRLIDLTLVVGNGRAPARGQKEQIEQRQCTTNGDGDYQQQREI